MEKGRETEERSDEGGSGRTGSEREGPESRIEKQEEVEEGELPHSPFPLPLSPSPSARAFPFTCSHPSPSTDPSTLCRSSALCRSLSCSLCPTNTVSPSGSDDILNCICDLGYTGPDGAACSACPPGTYKNVDGSGLCSDCAAGTYLNVSAGSACVACPAGDRSISLPATIFVDGCLCNAGYTGPDGGNCTACGAGTFKALNGSGSCGACPIDTFASSAGATACDACAEGTSTNGTTGRSVCFLCPLPTNDGTLLNGDFENDGVPATFVYEIPTGWTGSTNLVARISSGDFAFGSVASQSGSVHIAVQGAGSYLAQSFSLSVGVQYQLAWYAQFRPNSGPTVMLRVDVQGSTVFGDQTIAASWTQYSVTFIVQPEAGIYFGDKSASVEIKFQTVGGNAADSPLIDNIQLTTVNNVCNISCPAGYTGFGISGSLEGACTLCEAGKYKGSSGCVAFPSPSMWLMPDIALDLLCCPPSSQFHSAVLL